jgi:hypothetical protein
LATVAVSADYNDLINTPAPFDPGTLATVATTGLFTDLTDSDDLSLTTLEVSPFAGAQLRFASDTLELNRTDGGPIYVANTGGAGGILFQGNTLKAVTDITLQDNLYSAFWKITVDDTNGNITFSVNGVNKMRLYQNGDMDITGAINTVATIS